MTLAVGRKVLISLGEDDTGNAVICFVPFLRWSFGWEGTSPTDSKQT